MILAWRCRRTFERTDSRRTHSPRSRFRSTRAPPASAALRSRSCAARVSSSARARLRVRRHARLRLAFVSTRRSERWPACARDAVVYAPTRAQRAVRTELLCQRGHAAESPTRRRTAWRTPLRPQARRTGAARGVRPARAARAHGGVPRFSALPTRARARRAARPCIRTPPWRRATRWADALRVSCAPRGHGPKRTGNLARRMRYLARRG